MNVFSRATRALLGALLLVIAWAAAPASAENAAISLLDRARSHTIKVINNCGKLMWLQQANIKGEPELVKVPKSRAHTYVIPRTGAVSARIWAKTGCNKKGQLCKVGQTLEPCSKKYGCQPAMDSLLEATFSCIGPKCTVAANYDFSQVDGYTFPFLLRAKGTEANKACVAVNCTKLTTAACPLHADISTNNKYPQYKDVDLRYRAPGTKTVVGCFSPCEKLTAAKSIGGYGHAASDPEAIDYCCPAGADKAECNAVAPKTDYVKLVHKACASRAYAWAYDDVKGDHSCSGVTTLTMELCPGKKKKPKHRRL